MSQNSYQKIGGFLRDARKRQGLTLTDVAKPAKMSISFLSHIERGSRLAPLETLETLAGIVGADLGKLIANRQQPPPPDPLSSKIAHLVSKLSADQKRAALAFLTHLLRK